MVDDGLLVLRILLAASGVLLSCLLLAYYVGDRRWAMRGSQALQTLAEGAIIHELFRIGKQILLLIAALVTWPVYLYAEAMATRYPELASLQTWLDISSGLQALVLALFVITSVHDLLLRRRAKHDLADLHERRTGDPAATS